MADRRWDSSSKRRTVAKERWYGQILHGLYFQNRKDFASDFFCAFILPIDEHILQLWAKSDEVSTFFAI